jgi:hypothetical protein
MIQIMLAEQELCKLPYLGGSLVLPIILNFNQSMKQLFILCIPIFILTSCEKEIVVDLNSSDPQIIIEGNISDEIGPYKVSITKSVNFSDPNSFPAVGGATVIITDNTGFSETLEEVDPGVYYTKNLKGIEGRTYKLSVSANGKTYTAESTMPQKVNLDTITFNQVSPPGSGGFYLPVPVFQDPIEKGNNYRFIIKVNGLLDPTLYLNNDNVNNGSVNRAPIRSADAEIKAGDSVEIEFRSIDLSTYLYFFTLSQIAGGGPGGGTTPSNPPNNIKGDNALGYFSAHTIQKLVAKAQ